jgi:hypothetical protein
MADAMKITVIATGFRSEAAVASAAAAGAHMPLTTPARYSPRSPDEFPAPQQSPRRNDDRDVPTFIRKKAD